MPDTRLIERWLPIAALGEESVRERRSMTALPPIYYLHVWWARRPLVASRAAVLASLLPADADRDRFLHMLGIRGDPIAARRAIEGARRAGVRVENPYGYDRAFSYGSSADDRDWLQSSLGNAPEGYTILDPTAGGGSIPFETMRLGCTSAANDLNPVAALILSATVEWPRAYADTIKTDFETIAKEWRNEVEVRLENWFEQRGLPDQVDMTYLWARTVTCPYCDGLVPLSPNWRLAPDGVGVKLKPQTGSGPGTRGRICSFEIVGSARGTIARDRCSG